MLTLTHNPVEGTLLRGTHHGDGSTAVLTAQGRRRGRSTSCWYTPHSRDHTPKTHLTTSTTTTRQAAGYTVHTRDGGANATSSGRSTATERDRISRAAERGEAPRARAERNSETAKMRVDARGQ